MKEYKRYQELDALRGVAALMVAVFHFTNAKLPEGWCFRWGVTGVDLFFMISGFVIFMSISKVNTGLEFVISRVSRLYPAYWFCVTLTYLTIVLTGFHPIPPLTAYQYYYNITMFYNFFLVLPIDPVYWTLTAEMSFYISILLLFQFKKLKYINVIAILACILSLLIIGSNFNHSVKTRTIVTCLPFLGFIPLFLAGILFYKIYNEKAKLVERYLLIALCLVFQIVMFGYAGKSRGFINQFEYAVMVIIYFSLFTLFVNNKLRFIVSGITLFLGRISYSLYLVHYMIFAKIFIPFLTDKWHINFWVTAFAIALPLAILLAAIITYFVEKPLNKLMKTTLTKKLTGKQIKLQMNK